MSAAPTIAELRAMVSLLQSALQPAVTPGTRVLVVGHEHDGLLLDLHGLLDSTGYDVTDVTLTGESVALTALFSRDQLLQFNDWCDDHLQSAHDLRMVSIDEARIERHEWERNFEPP